MEMQQLRYVVAVARARNFSRAAEQCHVSQPSLSQQIQKLEEELGERLFERLRREARLTAHGEAFLRRALRILDEVDGAARDAKEAKEGLRGVLTFGVLPTIAPYLLPKVLPAFSDRFPKVELVVQEDNTAMLIRQVLAYELDFALASQPILDARLEIRELFSEELVLALPPGHALTSKRLVNSMDLDGERLIVMKEGHCLGDQVLGFCEQRSSRPVVSFRSAQLETVQSLVRAGLGLSLIPKMAAKSDRENSPEYRSLQNPKPNRMLVAIWPKQRPPGRVANEFLQSVIASAKRRRGETPGA
jgi:LysR family hydrogen peroxide-inducible transcriptional activator